MDVDEGVLLAELCMGVALIGGYEEDAVVVFGAHGGSGSGIRHLGGGCEAICWQGI